MNKYCFVSSGKSVPSLLVRLNFMTSLSVAGRDVNPLTGSRRTLSNSNPVIDVF